jgi:hypothetical protein
MIEILIILGLILLNGVFAMAGDSAGIRPKSEIGSTGEQR